jgi:hypothetical protein
MNPTELLQLIDGFRQKNPMVPLKKGLERLAREQGLSDADCRLGALFWLLPRRDRPQLDTYVPAFLRFLDSQQITSLDDAIAAAVAFGCGWRPEGESEGEAWDDAIGELSLIIQPSVKKAVERLAAWGISFQERNDLESDLYLWALLSARALLGLSPHEDAYGNHQGSFRKFTSEDCSSIAYFTQRIRDRLFGFMPGGQIAADGFTRGILWHAMRQEDATAPPPQNRCSEGWLRYTDQFATCVSEDPKRNGRSLAIVNRDYAYLKAIGSVPLQDLRSGETISISSRIYKDANCVKVSFYRVRNTNFYERNRSSRTTNAPSHLVLRLFHDIPLYDNDEIYTEYES